MLTRETEHFLATGRAVLFYPVCEAKPRKLPSPRVIDLHPSPASASHVSAKRSSLLGRPETLQETVDDEGYRNEEMLRDNSAKQGYGKVALWLVDGEVFEGTDGSAFRNFPTDAETELRRRAGLIVGDRPASIVRIPKLAEE